MKLLLEVTSKETAISPDGGWNVGHLANLGLLLSCDGFSARFDLFNLNLMFDFIEDGESGEVKDQSGRIIDVIPSDSAVILYPHDMPEFSAGLSLDLSTLKEMGIEQFEQDDPNDLDDFDDLGANQDDSFDALESSNIMNFDLTEGVKKAFRRSGKKIKRGFRVTSGFRKGRVLASASSAFKPRKPARTRLKLKLAARKKKIIRILKGKRTRRMSASKRLVKLNKRLP